MNPKRRGGISIPFLILAAALPVAVFLAGQVQEIREGCLNRRDSPRVRFLERRSVRYYRSGGALRRGH